MGKLESAGNFLVVEQGAGALTRYTIDTEVVTAAVRIDDTFDVPSTAAIVGTTAWVVNAQIDDLLGMTDPDLPFTIRRIALD